MVKNSNKAKDPKKPMSPRPLKDSFEKQGKQKRGSPKKKNPTAAAAAAASKACASPSSSQMEPSRAQSGFLSYVQSALPAKCEEANHQAAYINSQYHSLSSEQKKNPDHGVP